VAGLSSAFRLDDLAILSRDLLHVFVAGPGYGEGIAIALPGRGWLLVDGCQVVDGRFPLLEIVERWRAPDEPIDCLVMTHPHRDHAYGMRRVLERINPRLIALSAPPDAPSLAFGAADPVGASTTAERSRRRAVVDAMLAFQRRFEASPDTFVPLVDGQVLPVSSGEVVVTACSPQPAHARRVLAAARQPGGADRPNELSAVLELTFGSGRLVLGSDLETAGRSGWNHVMAARPMLGDHVGLKVPHHGSPAAFHSDLARPGSGRAWWITPYSCARIPSLDPDGIPRFVVLNGRVLLTATPRSRNDQPSWRSPAEISIDDLHGVFQPGAPAGANAIASSPPPVGPLDAVWCVAFDRSAQIIGAWRGDRAFAVVAAP
jgi:hypothetical protein